MLDRYFQDTKYTEVLFPGCFTQRHPWKEIPERYENPYPENQIVSENLEKLRNIQVPILTLAHVTHNAQAEGIRKEYKFTTRQKVGKVLGEYDGRPCGESFRLCDSQGPWYDYIPPGNPVFPGFYSWWGIHSRQLDYSTVPDSELFTEAMVSPDEIERVITSLHCQRIRVYVPDYLKAQAESRYGNNAFCSKFPDLLRAYAKSRESEVNKICIRIGGTLRYPREICYVLIICIDSTDDRKELSDFKLLQPDSKPYQTNGLIDHSGKVKDVSAIPTFHPEYIITWVNRNTYSYETTAFAFYYPTAGSMTLCSQKCFEVTIKHELCIKTQPTPEGGKWKCPNKLPRSSV